jgi:hypothetical protein
MRTLLAGGMAVPADAGSRSIRSAFALVADLTVEHFAPGSTVGFPELRIHELLYAARPNDYRTRWVVPENSQVRTFHGFVIAIQKSLFNDNIYKSYEAPYSSPVPLFS